MGGRPKRDGSRKQAIAYFAVVMPPALALVWLSLQLLQQDRSLFSQRELERQQAAAQAAIRSLEQSLKDAERWFTQDTIPEGVVRLRASSLGISAHPRDRVLWLPGGSTLPPAAIGEFAEAEGLEFQGAGEQALRRYQGLARSPQPAIRAGALLRLARVHRRARRWDAALAAYRDLATLDHIAIDGMPADLAARRAVCFILEESGRPVDLAREVQDLDRDLTAGRWVLDRPAWELVVTQIAAWRDRPSGVDPHRKAFSAVAERFTEDADRLSAHDPPQVSRRVMVIDGTPVTLLLRRASPDEFTAIAILPGPIESWLQRSAEMNTAYERPLSLVTDAGVFIAGSPAAPGRASLRQVASDTGLPWTLVAGPGNSVMQSQEMSQRQRLLLAALMAIVLLLVGGGYVLWRGVQRELAVARLQTNFVAAVSHEFRTPLASLRHVTELLEEDDNLPQDKRHSFYQALGRNTERLNKLVESLLDFARMEEGRQPYDLQPVDVAALTASVVDDFRSDARAEGIAIECDTTEGPAATSRGDAASITFALWNLLDNAVKYSPNHRAIHVSVEPHRAGIAIVVRDAGLGIPRHEQKEIFRRFVRGEKAGQLGIKGTGLGLAMVSHIAQAHGGAVELESEEGVGSTFRLVLPAAG
jgi:signal transduction histidine kinase